MCVRATTTQNFYISFIKINEENKAMATGQQFTWQHHYIQTLAPQFTRPRYYQPTIYLAIPLSATQFTWLHRLTNVGHTILKDLYSLKDLEDLNDLKLFVYLLYRNVGSWTGPTEAL